MKPKTQKYQRFEQEQTELIFSYTRSSFFPSAKQGALNKK